jgi:D-glycero-D-manno-heptose 1,7-bisphosphate phosphatase
VSRPVVLLDRDGTIIVERHYLSDPDQVALLPGAAEGLRRLRRLGYGLVVVTNQSGLARGYFDDARLGQIHTRLRDVLRAQGVQLDGIYVCPHLPEDHCVCRKPRTGLVRAAAAELDFDPHAVIVVGDQASDLELGYAIAATTFLVRTGYGLQTEAQAEPGVRAYHVVDALPEVADLVTSLSNLAHPAA